MTVLSPQLSKGWACENIPGLLQQKKFSQVSFRACRSSQLPAYRTELTPCPCCRDQEQLAGWLGQTGSWKEGLKDLHLSWLLLQWSSLPSALVLSPLYTNNSCGCDLSHLTSDMEKVDAKV